LRKNINKENREMLNNDFTTNILDLKGVEVKKCKLVEEEIELEIERPVQPHECPSCGYITSLVHDYRTQRVQDLPIHGKVSILIYRKRRYKCGACDKRFYEKQKIVPKYHQLTSRFAYYLIEQLREKRSMKDISKANKVSVSKLASLLKTISIGNQKLPEVLSIDEFKGDTEGRKFQFIMTDPRNKKIIDILKGRESHILTDYFRQCKDRNNVKFVVMDMNRGYLGVIKAFFPKAIIIIDRFHVARYNTWAFENVRRTMQKKLYPEDRKYFKKSRKLLLNRMKTLSDENLAAVNIMLSYSNELTKAYLLKEKFYEFMDAKDSTSAKHKLKEFLMHYHIADIPEYTACVTMLNNWKPYILNSFDYRYNNGYTEGINNKIKVIKRIAFGFRNFDNLRTRVMFTT